MPFSALGSNQQHTVYDPDAQMLGGSSALKDSQLVAPKLMSTDIARPLPALSRVGGPQTPAFVPSGALASPSANSVEFMPQIPGSPTRSASPSQISHASRSSQHAPLHGMLRGRKIRVTLPAELGRDARPPSNCPATTRSPLGHPTKQLIWRQMHYDDERSDVNGEDAWTRVMFDSEPPVRHQPPSIDIRLDAKKSWLDVLADLAERRTPAVVGEHKARMLELHWRELH